MLSQQKDNHPLKSIRALSKLMDAQFRIPGTDIRFGFDGIIGLIPGVGDFVSFLISGYIVSTAAKKGASGFVVARMILNIVIDALVGAIPVLGDVFDVFYKANQRNVKLLEQHYEQGKHQGSAMKVVVPVVLVLLAMLVGLGWFIYKIMVWLF